MNTKKITLIAILSALAVVLSVAEGMLVPDIAFLPPGAKPGLANIVVMFAAGFLGSIPAFFITVLKSFFVFLTRGATAFFMSIGGGILSTCMLCILLKIKKLPMSYTGIGIICAVVHNAGQLICACVVTGTFSLINYAPALLAFGAVTGFLTGTVLKYTVPAINKALKNFR
ncbi:MAG: Gx transporter family protein [Clostridia bacterium]|nr:Gx transporter family protein [Clostridia bacterium]